MDDTTKAYFDNMVQKIDGVSEEVKSIKVDHQKTNDKVNHIENLLSKHISYNKGLDVKMRLTKTEAELEKKASQVSLDIVENEVEKKASWSGLKWVSGSFFTVLGLAVGIIGLIK